MLSLFIASENSEYWSGSVGNRDANTMDLGLLDPSNGFASGVFDIVSPTVNSFISFNPVAMYPTSPVVISFDGVKSGVKYPISFDENLPLFLRRCSVNRLSWISFPSTTRTAAITPLCSL